jgi:membrane-associated phospholipid phosphatase
MKKMNEIERILAVFGGFLMVASLLLAVVTEISARSPVAEYRRRVNDAPGVIQQGVSATYDRHIGYEQQTLASRWSFPDGHGTLGAGFAMFGLILIAVPSAAAKKRSAS